MAGIFSKIMSKRFTFYVYNFHFINSEDVKSEPDIPIQIIQIEQIVKIRTREHYPLCGIKYEQDNKNQTSVIVQMNRSYVYNILHHLYT